MIICSIKINNLFAYKGLHEIDLAMPQKGHNINMIVAKNGSGKTSLYRAINLLFKGVMFSSRDEIFIKKMMKTENKKRAIDYQDIFTGTGSFAGVINKDAVGEADECTGYIELELKDTRGAEGIITLKRSFSILKKGGPVSYFKSYAFSERLEVTRDGKTYTDKASSIKDEELSGASEELSRILNPRLVDFFFFDGEQLEDISRDLAGSLGDKIKELLNITALENLNKYIDAAKRAFKKDDALVSDKESEFYYERGIREQLKNSMEAKEAMCEEIVEEIAGLEGDKAKLQKEIDSRRSEQDKDYEVNKEAATKAGMAYEVRRSTFNKRNLKYLLHATNLEMLELAHSKVSESAMPKELSDGLKKLIPKLRKNLERLLKDNGQGDTAKTIGSLMKEAANTTIKDLSSGKKDIIGVDPEVLNAIINNEEIGLLYDEVYRLGALYDSRSSADKQINSIVLYNEDTKEEEETQLKKIDFIKGVIDEKRGRMYALKDELSRDREDYDRKAREVDALEYGLDSMRRYEEPAMVADALSKIVKEYTVARIDECKESLTKYMKECLDWFYPKSIIRVEIVDEFKIRIYKNGQKLVSNSAGQEQFIATAIIYSLFKVAVFDFPIIIDTPLGRVDDDNRESFFDQVYPMINEQVILLVQSGELGDTKVREAIERHLADLHIMHESGDPSTSALGHRKIELLRLSDIYTIREKNK